MMFGGKRSAQDFAEEIRSHIEIEADTLREEGMGADEARRKARVKFGNARLEEERYYRRSHWMWLENLGRDLRLGLRNLIQSPGFALTAIVTLALGVGANTAVFSVMNAVLLASLPVEHAEQLVYLRTSNPPRGTGTIDSNQTFSYPVYDALRKQNDAMTDVIAFVPLSPGKVAVRLGDTPEVAEGDMVSGTFFSGLGVKLAQGRGFTAEDETAHTQVAVLSYNYWTRRFARNPYVLGMTMHVNGVAFTIVGVSADGFEGLEGGNSTDFWIPLQDNAALNAWGNPPEDGKTYLHNPKWWCMRLIGRLKPGVSKTKAAAAMQATFKTAAYVGLGAPMQGEKPPTLSLVDAKGFGENAQSHERPLHMLMGMVALVLLIALTNVAMLLMARNATRQREFSMKLALGAGRADLLRQLLTESVLLVTAGGLLAWVFALVATRALGSWAKIEASLAPDETVLLFTLAILAVAAVLFGVAPLRMALSAGPQLALKTSASTSHADAGKSRMGRSIVALQMALCVVLLVGAGLLIRTLRNLEDTPLGMKVEGLVVFNISPHVTSLEQGRAFYRDLIGRMRELPGVESVTVMEERLGSWWSDNSDMTVDGKLPEVANGSSRTVRSNVAGPGFFTTLGIPILEGRDFNDSDTASSQPVGIINEEFAKRFFHGVNPIGHMIGTDDARYQMRVIAVVKNHKYRSVDEEPIPMAWYEYAQIPIIGPMSVELRVHGKPLAILPTVRKAVAQLDPNLPLLDPTTQRAQFDTTISDQLLFARLAGVFGLLAVVLVATGLYGTLSYRVNMRTAEIGVRMALGARRGQVVWMILRDSLLLAVIGIVVGVPLALAAGNALESSLYGVKAVDAPSYLISILGVLLVALLASTWPAARAASVEPLQALRTE